MAFKFIHTADWQVGKPFANFPSDLAGELSAARFSAIGRIAEIARGQGAAHVLVAGDVFDADDLPNTTVRRGLERMAEHAALTWVLLPGNHDPARIGGIWDRVRRFGVPANVILALDEAPLPLTNDVVVLPAPLTSKNPGRDPSSWMDQAASAPGVARIGLAHGSIQGFGSDGESSVLIARDRAARAGLAYLALGDWHGTTEVSADTWYSGTPEADRFPNNDPGNVLAVSVAAAGRLSVEKFSSAQFRWARLARSLRSEADIAALGDAIAALDPAPSRLLLQLTLSGNLSHGEFNALDVKRETWSARLSHLDVDVSSLALRATDDDFAKLAADPALLDAARQLAAMAADAANSDSATASLALQRLFGFVAEVAREVAR
jgi:Calcineurin-like phosphoesterase